MFSTRYFSQIFSLFSRPLSLLAIEVGLIGYALDVVYKVLIKESNFMKAFYIEILWLVIVISICELGDAGVFLL